MPASHAAASLALNGTLHAMGVVVRVDAGDDANRVMDVFSENRRPRK